MSAEKALGGQFSEAVSSGGYPEGVYYLPTSHIEHYDPPSEDPGHPSYTGQGGFTLADLRPDIKKNGITEPLLVAKSRHEVEHSGSDTVYAFDGNHRLAVAKEQGITHVPCLDAESHLPGNEDAVGLTRDEVRGRGGWEHKEK